MAIITVFEGNSQLGLAVAKALVREFEVRIAVRDSDPTPILPSSVKATIVKVDPSNEDSIIEAIKGSHGCFITTNTDFGCLSPYQKELQEGKNIANACDKARIRHVVFCSALSVVKTMGLTAQHMDAKADIDAYMQHLRLPMSCLILPIFYENLMVPPLRPARVKSDHYELAIPIGNMTIDLMSIDDVGEVTNSIFLSGDRFLYKTMSLSGDKLSVRDIASIMSRYLSPKIMTDKQVTAEQFARGNFPGAQDLATMFQFLVRVDQRASVDTSKRLNPAVQSFSQWVHSNVDTINKALDYPMTPEKDIWA